MPTIFYYIIITISIGVLFTQTMFFQKKPVANILQTKYTEYEDLWIKKENNENLLVLLHGMYSNPISYQEVAEKISQHGWDVYIPALPNSAFTPEELSQQNDYQWEDSLKVAFQKSLIHNKNYKQIALSGHSQGGALALTIAPSLTFLAGLIVVAAPIRLIHNRNPLWKNIAIFFSGILVHIVPQKGLFLKKKNSQTASLVENIHYNKEFLFGITLHSMNLGLRKTRKNLSKIQTPTLLIYEQGDKIVPIGDFNYIKEHISSQEIRTKVFNTPLELEPFSSRHRLFNYIYTKDELATEMIDFLNNLKTKKTL